jgi:HTH-type transcriptional regulator / antitoxin HipB
MLIHNPDDLAKFTSYQRKQKKLSQLQIGASVGLKQTTISKFERKPESSQLDTLFRILSSLDLEIHIIAKQTAISLEKSSKKQKWGEEW